MASAEQRAALLAVLGDVRDALAAPAQDGAFGQTPGEVAAEVERLTEALRAGYSPDVARWLFATTGDLHEVAIANGWGEAFLDLARRAEAAQALYVVRHRLRRLWARAAPAVLAASAATLLAAAWWSGRLIWTVLAGAVAVFLPAWWVWVFSGTLLNSTPLWARFWEGLRRPDAATWMLAALSLGLLAAVAWVACGPAG